MQTLFDIAPELPEGFQYYPDFLSAEEEQYLLMQVKRFPLANMRFQGFEARRRTASFGYDYHFDTRRLSPGKAIPPEFHSLIARVAEKLHMAHDRFAELLITEYAPGTVINWHRDAPPFGLIAGISLGAACRFRLRPYGEAKRKRSSMKTLDVAPRSLYLLSGEVRDYWEHSIAPVKATRYSMTLRSLRHDDVFQNP